MAEVSGFFCRLSGPKSAGPSSSLSLPSGRTRRFAGKQSAAGVLVPGGCWSPSRCLDAVGPDRNISGRGEAMLAEDDEMGSPRAAFFTSISTSASIRPRRSSTCRLWLAAADRAAVSGSSWLIHGVPRRRHPSHTSPAKASDGFSRVSRSTGSPSGVEKVHRIFLRLHAQQL